MIKKSKDFKNNKITIGTAGVFSKIKRFDMLLESLVDYTGKMKIELLIAGEGSEKKYLEEIVLKIKNKNIDINFLGKIKDMDKFYCELDLFVFPGHNESFGLVVLEAMVRNIPVVCFSDLGGTISYLQHGKNSIILKDGLQSLKNFWYELSSNPEMLFKLQHFINGMEKSAFDIINTRSKLDELFLSSRNLGKN